MYDRTETRRDYRQDLQRKNTEITRTRLVQLYFLKLTYSFITNSESYTLEHHDINMFTNINMS